MMNIIWKITLISLVSIYLALEILTWKPWYIGLAAVLEHITFTMLMIFLNAAGQLFLVAFTEALVFFLTSRYRETMIAHGWHFLICIFFLPGVMLLFGILLLTGSAIAAITQILNNLNDPLSQALLIGVYMASHAIILTTLINKVKKAWKKSNKRK